ncbi:MAG: hypothetical protein EXX96DRAFT_622981 [Benjaminiella poitrasii]|nr:MAG: hypothetical protein EXX96DRAFT_622981 [Benjaminiella poitrasii]
MFYQALKKPERAGDLVVVAIDEYLASQKVFHVVGFSLLACTVCHTLWQRDVNAAISIMKTAKSVWGGEVKDDQQYMKDNIQLTNRRSEHGLP